MKKYLPWIGVLLLIALLSQYDSRQPIDPHAPKFSTTDASQLRFRNVRQISYRWNDHEPSGLRLLHHKKLLDTTRAALVPILVLNAPAHRAYIRFSPYQLPGDTLHLVAQWPEADSTFRFWWTNGTMPQHFTTAALLYQALDSEAQVTVTSDSLPEPLPLWHEGGDRSAYLQVMDDFYRLVELY